MYKFVRFQKLVQHNITQSTKIRRPSINMSYCCNSQDDLDSEWWLVLPTRYCLKCKGNQFQNGGRCQSTLQDMAEEAKKLEKREKTKERGDR